MNALAFLKIRPKLKAAFDISYYEVQKMQHKWWKIGYTCPKCDRSMRMTGAAHASDGQFQFMFVCDEDGLTFQYEPYASKLQEDARDMDTSAAVEASREKLRSYKRLAPPLAPAAGSKNQITDKDLDFLKRSGIAPR